MNQTSYEERELFPAEYEGEYEGEYEAETEYETGGSSQGRVVAELANELLEIGSEAELDQFLGKLASSVLKGASSFIKSPVGKALGGVLKTVAKTALPVVGGALGSMVLPGLGTAIGSRLGSMAGGLLEVGEAEALGEAEAEFEAAQRYVRFARSAYANAARAPRDLPPRAVVRASSVAAAGRYAPALLRDRQGDRYGSDRGYPRRGAPERWRSRRRGSHRPVYRTVPWPYVAGNDGYTWPGYSGTGWPPFPTEPAPWAADRGANGADGPGGPDGADSADGGEREATAGPGSSAGGAGQSPQGRWVRHGHRIVVLGI